MTVLFILIVAFLAFLAAVSIVLFLVGPVILLQPRRRTAEFYRALGQPLTPSDAGLPYEEINVITGEGMKLNSWLIKAPAPAKGTVLYLHGVADCKIDGIRHARILHDHHFNVFLYDARRHGRSDGKFCTYGYYEKDDVIRIIDYLVSRTDLPPGKIGIIGTSMGAAVALQAAAMDKRIAAVVAENSFATLRSVFDDYQRRIIKLPFHFLRNIVIVRSELMAKFKASDVSPLEAVKQIGIPILFVYGTMDHLISHQYSISLYEQANGPKELFPVEDASHNNIWQVAGQRYEKKILEFFERTLP
ncbi:MAG TPA: alpha/beta hydrolase [Bacteroidota bacterium]|jgi:pimeloyl-ACP methyl ester carboxylesterase|nr:alpha/beta hydrolase [Bacteroidota bacterium]